MSDIVVGIDGSPFSATALEWAVSEARSRGTDVRAVLSWALDGRPAAVDATRERTDAAAENAAVAVLRDAVQPVRDRNLDVKIHERVVTLPPVPALVEESEYAEMLVVGSRGLGRLRRALIGSVSSGCALEADVPVVVVRPPAHDGPRADERSRPVAVGVDGSPESRVALAWAAGEARLLGVPLRVVHTWTLPSTVYVAGYYGPPPSLFEAEEQAVLDDAVSDTLGATPDVEVTTHLLAGHPAHALIKAAAGAAVLVVGARGHGGFAGLALGSVSHQCVTHAPCPVAVIRAPVAHKPLI